ncbi:MAG TPA: hypothetical protein PKN13_07885 [Accumulibacter sp.]|nr:hypothetical protein [Accumulibacter sp.]HMW17752.1 hypothetical protein [Accumulibacter sp.]HNC17916.1 hypothetical protein [Accumulibacter sp.]HND80463.1 hypothetical protein [Accumulibacter sp.]HNE12982.1 hypothetical protein [Accumulibacter sp.]
MFCTLQDRLPQELELAGITDLAGANRIVGNDNGVSFEGMKLQILANCHRCHYVKAKVTVLRHTDRTRAILHGPRKLADYDEAGKVIPPNLKGAA